MTTFKFAGKVLPEHIKVSLNYKLSFPWVYKPESKVTMTISISNSQIAVECTNNDGMSDDDIAYVWTLAADKAHALVDSISFYLGSPLSMDMHTYQVNGGKPQLLTWRDPRLTPTWTTSPSAKEPGLDRNQVVHQLALGNQHFAVAMNDLKQALIHHHSAPVYCARTVETLRHLVSGPGLNTGESWDKFRTVLNIERDFVQHITDASKGPRHGEGVPLSHDQIGIIVLRAWQIMNRFIEYEIGNRQPLTAPKFPPLTED